MGSLSLLTKTMSSIEISEITNKQHAHVMRDIRTIEGNLANPNLDGLWKESFYKDGQGKDRPLYLLSKKGTLLLVSKYDDNIRLSVIDRWEHLETKELSRKELALMIIDAEEEKERLQLQVSKLQPKADYLSHILASEDLIDIGQASKVLQLPYGRNIFFKNLREQGIFFKNRNEPKQEYISRGWFLLKEKIIETENKTFTHLKVLVTQKGLIWLAKTFDAPIKNTQIARIA